MRLTLKQFASIAALTALEASRQPIFLLLSTCTLLFIGLMPLLITHVIGESARMVRDSAFAVQFVSGLILGCYAATSTVTRELRKGTLASIITKPVNRGVFFAAKFAGVAMIMMVYSVISTMAAMLSTRTAAETFALDWWGIGPLFSAIVLAYLLGAVMNYIARTPFVSRAYWILTAAVVTAFLLSCLMTADPQALGHHHGHDHGHVHDAGATADAHFGAAIPWELLPAGILISLAILLLNTFAVTLALRFDTVPTLSICLAILMVGLMSDYLFGQRAPDHTLLAMAYGLVPNWQHFWAIDALGRGGIPWSYTLQAAAYAAVYGIVILTGGTALFYRMEVK